MTSSSGRAGGDFLARRNEVAQSRKGQFNPKDVLIVEDETFDADRLKATLHVMFGYSLQVRLAGTLGKALDAVIERKPEIVFLDDYLKPNDSAAQTIPFLRRAGYEGPIVVISGQVDRQRRAVLLTAGASDVIHKDDVDSVRIGESLNAAFAGKPGAPA